MPKIAVESLYNDSWVFNIIITCAGYDAHGAELFVESAKDIVGEVGSVVMSPPEDKTTRRLDLQVGECSSLRVIVYAVPCTIPSGKTIQVKDYPPFDMQVSVSEGERTLYCKSHSVNRWGGASINFEIKGEC